MAQHHDAAHASADDQYLNTTPGAGHEHTDANVWMIVQFAIWLLGSAVVVHVLMWLMFVWFVRAREPVTAPEFPLAVGQEQRLPAGPRLQRFPANEMFEFRQRENSELNAYGWVDRNAGTVHIPIAEAMRLTVERGLPSRAQAAPAADTTTRADAPGMVPSDSSSGRMMERRR
jgi:hypothetical protein